MAAEPASGSDPTFHQTSAPKATAPRQPVRESLRLLGSKLLPHDTKKTTCPPAPLISGTGPLILVPSMMRSGTHLLLDSLFNNFSELRRRPLFLDFDAYERAKLPPGPLAGINGLTVKTHYPQIELAEPHAAALAAVAARAVVLMPHRPGEQIQRSLGKWSMEYSASDFARLEKKFQAYWAQYSPLIVDFSTLLDPVKMKDVLAKIASRTELSFPAEKSPIMPARSRLAVYIDKVLTRMLGARAPRINTTIGYRLARRHSS